MRNVRGRAAERTKEGEEGASEGNGTGAGEKHNVTASRLSDQSQSEGCLFILFILI